MSSLRNGLRWCVALVIITALLTGVRGARAQSPQDDIEALALSTHLQNLRTHSYTAWIGGGLGDPANSPVATVLADTLDGWTLPGFDGDPDLSAADLARPVLLNFWASWCTPCRLEFPHMARVAQEPDAHAFDVVFVDMADNAKDARAFLAQFSPDLHVTVDENDSMASRARVGSIPTSILLDTNGQVLLEHVGLATPTVTAFIDAVAAHPGVGGFVAADHSGDIPGATLPIIRATSADPIQAGDTMTGMVDDAVYFHAYRYEGLAGESITVNLSAAVPGELDTYLVLMAADGTRIAENDDIQSGVITNSRLIVTLPEDGTYLIVATRFLEAEGFAPGEYSLTITSEPPTALAPAVPQAVEVGLAPAAISASAPTDGPQPPRQSDVATLHYGETVRGMLDDNHYEATWTFEGQAGDTIMLVMARTLDQPGGLDGYLILKAPDGSVLQEVDDSNNGVMPTLDAFTLPDDGLYTVVVTRFAGIDGLSTGEYLLTLTLLGDEPGPSANMANAAGIHWLPGGVLPPGLRRLFYNTPTQGTVTTANVGDWYLFEGRAGDAVTVRMIATSGDLDTFVIVTDKQGVELARVDDNPDGGTDAVLADFVLPADGSYLVRATRYGFANGPSSGDYTLALETEASAPDFTGDIGTVEPLTLGDIANGALAIEHPATRYTFEGQAGQLVTAAAQRTGGDLDLALVLRGPDGVTLASAQGGDNLAEARLRRVRLPADGTYTLDVVLEDLATSGDYRLIALASPGLETAGAFEPAPGLDVEVVLIWASSADLDLAVSGPMGDRGTTTARANDFCAEALPAPVERAIWDTGTAAAGTYSVSVRYSFNCAGTADPVQFMLALVADGQVVDLIGGTLARDGDVYTTPLVYPQ